MMGQIIKSGALEENGGKAACIALIGETGVGKSTAIRDWCLANDYGHATVWFNTMEDNGDVLGRTYDEEVEGYDHRVTMFATPEMRRSIASLSTLWSS
jgi:deoxyadenosine/deoxycytidine kinase